MSLTGKQFEDLSNALLGAFTYSTLQMMLRARLEKRLDHITRSTDLQTVVYDLISTAEREGWVYDLAREAHESVPGNPALAAVAASLSRQGTSAAGADHAASTTEASSSPPIPTIDPDNPPFAALRALLEAAFTAEELRRFCQEREVFRPLLVQFGPGHGLDDMVDRVIDFCHARLLWDRLLIGIAEKYPSQYARFEPRLRGGE